MDYHDKLLDDFNFIYDCGSCSSKEKVEMEVDDYMASLGDNRLNMLAVSHFHQDHINGLPKLLDSVATIDYIVLPYIYPEERAYLAVTFGSSKEDPIDPTDNWYVRFLINPIKYFKEFESCRKTRFILIDGRAPVPPDEPPEFFLTDEVEKEVKRNPNKSEDISQIYDNEEFDSETQGSLSFINHKQAILLGRSKLQSKWYFKFFCLPAELEPFKECVGNLKCSSLLKILQDSEETAKLKQCYRSINTNLNKTTLALYHSPYISDLTSDDIADFTSVLFGHESDKLSKAACYDFKKICPVSLKHNEPYDAELDYQYDKKNDEEKVHTFPTISSLGQMLLGDLEFNTKTIINTFQDHYSCEIPNSILFSVPHHGARNSWDNRLLDAKCLGKAAFCIISHALISRYKHPHIIVVDSILRSRCDLLLNNESSLNTHKV